ncbi:hypothetical protein BN946_scf184829.g29 [Trametes cinnabarina]|uniref:HMG box domain-containing protein n=1 Tax=Pycnoporus cinnabarinus TaxID=5643 RepID=A0A060S9M7_PYCCI|nr:hypothetical protein BN946_scf184829.g29 [Trametes cinnabarina]
MPAFRNVRRSRRLSRQPPRDPGSDEFDIYDLELMYPQVAASSSAVATPNAQLPPADETGEPEVDPESPLLSPSPRHSTFPGQRSSHSRKKKPGHIPRPPNAFMIFRSELWTKEKIKSTVERDHRQISRIAGNLWNKLTDDERAPYKRLAEEAKVEHARLYPQYKYSPIYRRDKPAKRKPKHEPADKILRCHTVAQLIQQGFEGDDLKKELDKRAGKGGTYDLYNDAPHPRQQRASRGPPKKASSRAGPRRMRAVKIKGEEEYVPSRGNTPMRDSFVKDESISPVPHLLNPCHADIPDTFVSTSDIPPIDLGESCLNEEIKFTNPFASAPRSPAFFIGGPVSAGSCSLSEDFLAPTAEESKHRSSSPFDAFSGLFVPGPDGPSYDPLDPAIFSPELPTDNAYYAPEYYPGGLNSEPDFSEWMRYDE